MATFSPNYEDPVFAKEPVKGETGVKELDFYKAIKAVVEGNKVTRQEWGDKSWYGYMEKEVLMIHSPKTGKHQWIISLGDIMGEDYYVL